VFICPSIKNENSLGRKTSGAQHGGQYNNLKGYVPEITAVEKTNISSGV
jgi:hypothetical protein